MNAVRVVAKAIFENFQDKACARNPERQREKWDPEKYGHQKIWISHAEAALRALIAHAKTDARTDERMIDVMIAKLATQRVMRISWEEACKRALAAALDSLQEQDNE